ncbi:MULTISPECIES: aminoacyl-tRNA hydrolase [Dietzia]|uniref:aminoacyl-tRNA hydrolase n=1 Tax=Dietzia TaxID=37914 RepID=UPI0015CC5D7D|nr:aminoacyl-tRNA hydrolase [Dietzia sp. CQ4]MBB1039184.1 aminoacyl-tRNA hydrolase [Dietzia natronolimnaea]MBB1042914.1 aminoacyl-tRNA hydrolase [Dietzia sp. Cai40]MBB1045742.1 aminoacyl-tRNA hydrolase [Dietzia sp. DQ11-44]MBB1049027.1 aminoacyl-tRNA hydrolase [Dietzia cercidiphylli]MBB1055061.1 aminoacyl-tRNA hydrolase [Dietzia sp. B44]MBB1058429.1 aminoacyl-tRNA hydrolase [Dietzia sp. B19]MBC7297072.1 aminoacyl-tRNA hydrolase [Dietzia sp.]
MSTADAPGPRLVVGLANPGPDYEGTRHNIGWDVLVELASRALPMPASFSTHKRTNCEVAQTRLADQAVVLARPRSYMNLSGGPVAAVAKYFSVAPTEVIVVHDEIDIDFGQVRLKRGGGEGGHNGLRSVTSALGTRDYIRVRAGVGRPPGRMAVADYVLKRFSKLEQPDVPFLVQDAADAVELLLTHGLETAQNQVHSA